MVLASFGGAVYVVPLTVAIVRRAPDLAAVVVINVVLGWTVIGWFFALSLALRSAGQPRPPAVLVQNFPPPWPELPRPYWHRPLPPSAVLPPSSPDDPDAGDRE